jgi:hypothetical protein
VTRDELLAWLDQRVGVFVTASTNLGPYGATAPLLETSGNLRRTAVPGGGAHYILGDATLDVSKLDDAQVAAAEAFQGDWDGVDIPLDANVLLVISDRLVEPS